MPTPSPPQHARRAAAVVRFLASGSALAVGVAGIPYALTVTIGAPWPHQATSLDDLLHRLAQPVSDPFVLQTLALVGWACWAYFIAVLLRESLWLLGRLPALLADAALLRRHTATLPAHRAAAALLAGTLILALIGMWRLPAAYAAVPAASPSSPPVAASAPQHVPPAKAAKPAYTTYTVQSGDTLWDIADKHLGDPLRWPKIYQLSCAIRQSDGRLLSDPDLITPGWQLRLPQIDAPAPVPEPAQPDSPRPPADRLSPAPTPAPGPEPDGQQPHGHDESRDEQRQTGRHEREHGKAQERRPATIPLGVASAIGVTTAAGIAAAIGFARWHAARRRTPRIDTLATPFEDDDLLLSDALGRSNQAHLATLAARHHNPETLPRRTAPAEPAEPGTVTVAEHHGHEVRVDYLATPGGVHLTGPGADDTARHLAIAIASAAERLRPAPSRVRLIAPRGTLRRLLPTAHGALSAWTVTDTLTQAFETAEHVLLECARHEQHFDVMALERNRSALHVLLVDGPVDDPARLQALAAGATCHLAVITLGSDSDHLNQLTVAADGTANGPLPAFDQATMFLLAPEVAAEFLDTLHAAHGRRPAPAASEDEPEERAREQAPAPAPQRPSPPSVRPAETAATHTMHIRLLGGFKLFVHGKECALTDTRKEETREFIALLAAHPEGLRGEEIADKMQLSEDPVAAKSEIENLRRAARRVFRGATGKKEVAFVLLSGQMHKLDPQYITTDVTSFTDALKQAAAADSTYARADALGRATAVYAGPLCDGSDYLWAHGRRAALHRHALDALMLLAEHTAQHSADAEPALALLNQAADLDPENERVYRRIIQRQLALGRDDAAHRTLGLLTERLAAIDAEPEAATLALLRESNPPRHGAATSGTVIRR